jgi:hypothetical protein
VSQFKYRQLTARSVKDHRKLKSGHRTRFWCSQDEARKKKSKASQNPDIRNRDNVGMKRFDVVLGNEEDCDPTEREDCRDWCRRDV